MVKQCAWDRAHTQNENIYNQALHQKQHMTTKKENLYAKF